MMSGLNWLMGANAVLWVGLGLYMALMLVRQRALERRLKRLEEEHD